MQDFLQPTQRSARIALQHSISQASHRVQKEENSQELILFGSTIPYVITYSRYFIWRHQIHKILHAFVLLLFMFPLIHLFIQ